jgi:hypothetical protein
MHRFGAKKNRNDPQNVEYRLANAAAVFLASKDSSFITGIELSVDGGLTKYEARARFRCLAFRMTKWFRQSLRIEPIKRSAYGFCQGLRGAVSTSSICNDAIRRRTSLP